MAAAGHLGEAVRAFRELGTPTYEARAEALAARLGLPAKVLTLRWIS
jgi:hypothetical protein